MCKQLESLDPLYFEREWDPVFRDACAGKGDADGSWLDDLDGTAPSVGLSATQVTRRKTRRREGYAEIMALVPDKFADLKAAMRGGPNKQLDTAYRILKAHIGTKTTALATQTKLLEWHGMSIIKDVGHSMHSIADYDRHVPHFAPATLATHKSVPKTISVKHVIVRR